MSHNAEPGKGVLFTNDKKAPGSKAPDFKGTYMVPEDCKKGDVLKISGWVYNTAKGSLISLKEDSWQPDPNYKPRTEDREVKPKFDDEIPF